MPTTSDKIVALVGILIVVSILLDIHRQNNIIIYEARAEGVEVVATSTDNVATEVLLEVRYDKAGIERLIRQTFPEAPDLAVAIAKAESGLVATAYNPEAHRGCNGSVGVFQIACVHVKDKESLKDVETNIKKAREIYLREGWRPWGAYTNGSYKKYL